MTLTRIRKRDGKVVRFDRAQIRTAIVKAFAAIGEPNVDRARTLAEEVERLATDRFVRSIPSVEDIQDLVEHVLIQHRHEAAAKAYILYRHERQRNRDYQRLLGAVDDLKLGINALRVLERRYLRRNERGEVMESPRELFRRVAHAIAAVDRRYDPHAEVGRVEETFYHMMAELEFLPNSPTLMNAGTPLGQLAACFVVPIADDLADIFDALKAAALIHQSGGGTGFSFGSLRPRGDVVRRSGGVASGPLPFLEIFDRATEAIKQGGRRRGANMAVLSVYHPDIMEFITAKSHPGALTNFNLSVGVDDRFMRAVDRHRSIQLVNPRTGRPTGGVPAADLFHLIASNAWETGDPGLLFLDAINRANPTPSLGRIEATNPCGEQPLLPWESCTLGSINLARLVKGQRIDWTRLATLVRDAVHFLDNTLDASRYPLPAIGRRNRENRKIGLGIMGFAEALIRLGIPYDSPRAVSTANRVMRFLDFTAHRASSELARSRGPFPNFARSRWRGGKYGPLRNATVTTIAPTGTISILAGCSSGIEPLFAVSFVRNVMEGVQLIEVNEQFESEGRRRGFLTPALREKIARSGSVRSLREVPADLRRTFATALDVAPEWHLRIQQAFQRYTDNAVSKTINLPSDATIGDVQRIYHRAWELRLKGITVYRYGSKPQQVLSLATGASPEGRKHVVADSEYSGGCAGTVCPH